MRFSLFAELPPIAEDIHGELVKRSVNKKFLIRGDEFVYYCPFHDDRRKPNLYVNYHKGTYHCFACGAGGSTTHLYAYLFGVEIMDMRGGGELRTFWETETVKVGDDVLESLHERRRISLETLSKCDIRMVNGNSTHEYASDLTDRKLFPLYDRQGRYLFSILGYSEHRPPKYKLIPAGKKSAVFGLHLLDDINKKKQLFVVEGVFDALSFLDENFNSVSLNGVDNYRLVSQLPATCDLILLPDFDDMGRQSSYKWALYSVLCGHYEAKVLVRKDGAPAEIGKDANDVKRKYGTVAPLFEWTETRSALEVAVEGATQKGELTQFLILLSQAVPTPVYLSVLSYPFMKKFKSKCDAFPPIDIVDLLAPHIPNAHILKALGIHWGIFIYALRSHKYRAEVLEHFLPHEVYPILTLFPPVDEANELPDGIEEKDVRRAIRHVRRVLRGARPSSFVELAELCEVKFRGS